MTRLAGNWQFLLISALLKGKFFIRPDIAMAMGPQVNRLLSREGMEAAEDQERSIEIICVNESGKETKFFYGEDPNDNLSTLYDEAPEGSIAKIPVKGSMLKYGTACDYGTMELASFILEAAAHKNISGIVLDFDSGGGAVDAVPPLSQAILMVKQIGKPIVSSVDLACSAAYWNASETGYIVADNSVSAEVGSIGVMMSFMDVRGYYEKEGVTFHSIYSNESGDKNLAFEKALNGEYDQIKEEQLDPLARQFQKTVRENRGSRLNTSVNGILTGKTFFAEEALSIGLIDRIGTSTTAVEIALAKSHANKFI